MRTEWILEQKDYRAAQALFSRGSIWSRLRMFTFMWLLPGLALLCLTILLIVAITNRETANWSIVLSTCPILLFLALFRLLYWNNLRLGYKRLFLNGDPSKPVYMDIDQERVISGVPGSSEGKFFWPTIIKFAEDDKIAILYVSKRMFLMIPKNKLPNEVWTEMKSIIHTHLPEVR